MEHAQGRRRGHVGGRRPGVRVPVLLLGGQFEALERYLGFVVGTMVGLVVTDLLTGDVAPESRFSGR